MSDAAAVAAVFLLLGCACAHAQTPDVPHAFGPVFEPVPPRPLHDGFADETARTPEGAINPSAEACDYFLERSIAGALEKTAARTRWEEHGSFLNWAVWGYLSPDSRFRGDERLVEMGRRWLDRLFVRLSEPPADEKARKGWEANRLDSWNFHDYTMPLIEIAKRPALAEKLGPERVARFRGIVLDNVRANTTPQAWNDLAERAETYVNIATHPMAVFVHGWVLTGEEKYLRMAQRLVGIMARDQMPNGMFPYRYRIHGPRHLEYETMYYHAINLRALYLYWWATGSAKAGEVFRKAAPYYPLNLEPPYHFNDGPDIWWKDQWRTFWPVHVAMVAAAARDGENAWIAYEMGRKKVSFDRIDLTLGAHAYRLLGASGVVPKPPRTDFLIEDPDIRGVRLRAGRWSSTFSAGSFTYTRTSAMRVRDDGGAFSALHMARPYIRVAPLERASRVEPDYGTLGASGAETSVARTEGAAAVSTVYRPALTPATWAETQPVAPWTMRETWLFTPAGAAGLIESVADGPMEAREVSHQFRFIVPGDGDASSSGGGLYTCGDIRFRVRETDFPHTVVERVRRYALSETDRRDWQFVLTDVARTPEHIAQTARPADGTAPPLHLPATRRYEPGTAYFSLTEVSPASGPGFTALARFTDGKVRGFRAAAGGAEYLVLRNDGPERTITIPFAPAAAAGSWLKPGARPLVHERTLRLPADAVALFVR